MTKTKQIYTANEAVAMLTMVAVAGDLIREAPPLASLLMSHFMETTDKKPSKAQTENFSKFIRELRKLTIDTQNKCSSEMSVYLRGLRITIEYDPAKDFTKPSTDTSVISFTE
jgi:hypothetical protein